jgi:hypothetical protein
MKSRRDNPLLFISTPPLLVMADPDGGYPIPGGGHEQGRNEVVGQFEDRLQFPSCGLRGSQGVALQRIGRFPGGI